MSTEVPLSRRVLTGATWPLGMAWTAWHYIWRILPVYRAEDPGSLPEDLPPPLPAERSREEVQPPSAGSGPLFHRLYSCTIADASMGAEDLVALLSADPNRVTPWQIARFRKTHGTKGQMRQGDEFLVNMPGPWDGPVRVVDLRPDRFRFATLAGHLEAGQIEWRAWNDGELRFAVESWARGGDRLSALLHDRLRMAKEAALHVDVRGRTRAEARGRPAARRRPCTDATGAPGGIRAPSRGAVIDAIVIGAGPNGLVAANLLADSGLDVVVCEEQTEPGGGVRSAELTVPGYVHDVFSAFYPFAVASPAIRQLELERWGLRWLHAPLVLAHPAAEGPTAVLSRDLEETAASLEELGAGDGETWKRLYRFWSRLEEPFMQALNTPFPPVRPGIRLAAELRVRGSAQLARIGLLSLRRFAQENFTGPGGALLLGGNALHSDLTPEMPGSAFFGLVLCGIGQHLGYPIPEGGAGRLTDALVRRLQASGGVVQCGRRVNRILVEGGRATGVRLADGEVIRARVAVLADVGAPQLYEELLDPEDAPPRILRSLRRFQYDNSTIKVDWALKRPVPWTSAQARRAGTVHIAESLELLSETTTDLERGRIPARPFLILGQYSMADPSRAPEGGETAWAYSHVPQHTRLDAGGELRGVWDEPELAVFAGRMEDEIEQLAPGFKQLIVARNILGPRELERLDRNLVGGAINGGTAKLHQQLIFRPVLGLARPETPIRRLYLASASAHPGGGVHGAPGAIAARALLSKRLTRTLRTPR